MLKPTLGMDWMKFRIDEDLARSGARPVTRPEKPIGVYIRDAVLRAGQLYHPALAYSGPRKLSGLRMYLSFDFVSADDWGDLQDRLLTKGYALAESDAELVVCTIDGEYLCDTAQIGHAYAALMERFSASFPDSATRH